MRRAVADSRTRRRLVRAISGSRRRVTLLFTDVEGSTELFEKRGDVEGRLLVDQHNRLVFPLVRRFRGHVVKTIGDSVMARFDRADDAVRAAIAIQQSLEELRRDDPDFVLRVRIGIHSGKALVEQGDVFGDVVNTASRVEARAAADQILVSTAAARGLDRRALCLARAGSFKPKGKRRTVGLYAAQWKKCESLVGSPTRDDRYVGGRERAALGVRAGLLVATLGFLYHAYVRYLIADSERIARLFGDPATLVAVPSADLASGVAALCVGLAALAYARHPPQRRLRAIHAASVACVGFVCSLGVFSLGPLERAVEGDRPLWESEHLFVRILEDGTLVRERAGLDAPILRSADAGALFLLEDVEERASMTWNRVRLGAKRYGYVARAVPERPGAPRKRLSIANPFRLTVRDAAAGFVALLAFAVGYARFSQRPA